MGYDSVAHKADTHVPEDLFEKVGGLWQNINEVTRTEDAGERQDDCLILEYDSVYIPEGADCLVIDADALAQSTMDVYLDGVHHASLSCRNSMICPVPVIIRAGLPRQRRKMHRTAEVFVICRFLWRILERQAAKQCSGFVVRAMCGSAAGDSRRLRRTDGSYCEGICIRACRMQIQQKQYTQKRG